jgi:hypothetical protein
MKQKALLFSALICMSLIVFTSNKTGTATNGQGNATGGPGSMGNKCSNVGCHGGGLGSAVAGMEVRRKFKPDSNTVVNSYIPDSLYTVRLNMSHITMHVFGFQMEALKYDDSSSKGTFMNLSSKLSTVVVGGKTLLESVDTFKVAGTNVDVMFTWKAPAKGTGLVRFYTMVIASNGDGIADGDVASNTYTFSLGEALAVNTPTHNISWDVYPNPATNYMMIQTNNAETGLYAIRIIDIHGKTLQSTNVNVTNQVLSHRVELGNYSPGIYFVNISKDDYQKVLTLTKE